MFKISDLLGSGFSPLQAQTLDTSQLREVKLIAATDTTSTLAVASVTGGNVVVLSETPAGAVTLTMPTAANIIAALPQLNLNDNYVLRVINNGLGGVITMATNTGITTSGTLTLATNTWREFLIEFPTATTVKMTSIGTGTTS